MKTTKSASLKIRKKAPLSRKAPTPGRPRSTSLSKLRNPSAKKGVVTTAKSTSSLDAHRRETDWNSLKSTSLIFEMIRRASKIGDDRVGKVKTMVSKIENTEVASTTTIGTAELLPAETSPEQQQPRASTPCITNSDVCKSDAREAIKVSTSSSREISPRNIESEDQGDGLISREVIGLLAVRGNRESSVEHPSEYQEITVADQTILKRSQEKPLKRARRASFELKRMMFEQIQSRESETIVSAEPVLPVGPQDRSTFRLCGKDACLKGKDETRRGFERHTSAWSMRTSKDNSHRHAKTPVVLARRAFARRKPTAAPRTKLLEARDSIELARIPVRMKLPACRRKILLLSNSRPAVAENDDTSAVVKSQGFRSRDVGRVARLKKIFSRERTPENHDFVPSTESKARKNPTPYPSSKSQDDPSEKSRAPGSLKFLSRLGGSNGELENGFSNATARQRRKSSVSSAVDGLFDDNDEKQSGFAPAPRTSSSLSSNSSIATNRSQGSTASRPNAKPKAAGLPTPAARSTPSSKSSTASNDESLSTCKVCNRRFATDRIGLHEQICAKTSQKKRKQFDAVTHRVRGTELESFVQKPGKKQGSKKSSVVEPSKSNWRRKHEDFINAIRSAKQMQVHLASGGKLSDLPPPPPSDTSDYVQCPHCSRKFNQGAAERHIPKCENMQHNKPNPRAQPRSIRR